MDKITVDEMTENQTTIKLISDMTNREVSFINKAIRESGVTPVAKLNTGKRGRPPMIYIKSQLLSAVENLIESENVVQTNQEHTESFSKIENS